MKKMPEMKKKGMDLSINTVIVAIIALLVLAVVIYIFRDQISKIASSFTKIGGEAGKQAENTTGLFKGMFNK